MSDSEDEREWVAAAIDRLTKVAERIATALEQAALERMPLNNPVAAPYYQPSVPQASVGPATPEPPPYGDVSPEFRQSRDLPPAPFLPIGWTCPVHHGVKTVPAGVSRKSGKPYDAFLACPEPGCDQKPPRR